MKLSKKQLQEQRLVNLANIKAGILSMLEAYERYAEGRKPYLVGKNSPPAELVAKLNEMTPKKFEDWLKQDMLKISEWLEEHLKYLHLEDVAKNKHRCTDSIISGKECSRCKRLEEGDKVSNYYSYKCCQSNTCKCGRKVTK